MFSSHPEAPEPGNEDTPLVYRRPGDINLRLNECELKLISYIEQVIPQLKVDNNEDRAWAIRALEVLATCSEVAIDVFTEDEED